METAQGQGSGRPENLLSRTIKEFDESANSQFSLVKGQVAKTGSISQSVSTHSKSFGPVSPTPDFDNKILSGGGITAILHYSAGALFQHRNYKELNRYQGGWIAAQLDAHWPRILTLKSDIDNDPYQQNSLLQFCLRKKLNMLIIPTLEISSDDSICYKAFASASCLYGNGEALMIIVRRQFEVVTFQNFDKDLVQTWGDLLSDIIANESAHDLSETQ